ncbi:hypothetical protein IM697_24745 [Streptomyces ferrugineus]|uniref:Uncharacterized protein n=1 Tax=Streptomyces ferrugineus TaxID=1413221 RepID=A0A7M2SE23_9ACTN|nr:hypothetical protein [Streptomyces ferrugineus]QOV33421.1 hypothetical protein IM697_24745 [Streptomyces ferrugineus]
MDEGAIDALMVLGGVPLPALSALDARHPSASFRRPTSSPACAPVRNAPARASVR